MAQEEKGEGSGSGKVSISNIQYPLDASCYEILDEIGMGVSAVVYKAKCIPMGSIVAIKAIDLEKSKADLDSSRREAKTMTLLSHPNILKAHCSFKVERSLWVVMPFMFCGSLQSIMASSFSDGLSESCIATVLREILSALAYLHDQGHLHGDVNAGNILIDSDGSVKLADFGDSASIYESSGYSGPISSSSSLITDVAGTPYWMAPEVIHPNIGYDVKADIWSFGITALELAHGRPPLSHVPPSRSLILKITERFGSSDQYEKDTGNKNKKFSKYFKQMVGLCLNEDPSGRPSVDKLIKHPFFENCEGPEFLVNNVLKNLLSVEERFRASKALKELNLRRPIDWKFPIVGEEASSGDAVILNPAEILESLLKKDQFFGQFTEKWYEATYLEISELRAKLQSEKDKILYLELKFEAFKLKHTFSKSYKGPEILLKNVLNTLSLVEKNLRPSKVLNKSEDDDKETNSSSSSKNVKQRRTSGWNFNIEGFELDPVFPEGQKPVDTLNWDPVFPEGQKPVGTLNFDLVIENLGKSSEEKEILGRLRKAWCTMLGCMIGPVSEAVQELRKALDLEKQKMSDLEVEFEDFKLKHSPDEE